MLRSELIDSIEKINKAILGSNLQEIAQGDPERIGPEIVGAYNRMMQELDPVGPIDESILTIFGLRQILDADWWGTLLVPLKDEKTHRDRIRAIRNLEFLLEKMPQIVALLSFRNPDNPSEFFRLILPESDAEISTPQRITAAIEGVRLLYIALCDFHNVPSNTLALVHCDSGSDKSFDFTGLPQIIEQVKNTVFEIVDRIIFFREKKYSERVKCVAESLPVLTQISDMVETKKISPEQAELLRRNLIAGATKFLETGATIPELKEGTRYEPSSLLAAAPTLLLEGPIKQSPSHPSDWDTPRSPNRSEPETNQTLTAEEIQHLKSLIAKAEQT